MNEYEIWIANRLPGIQYRHEYLGTVNADYRKEAEEMARKVFSTEIYGFCYGNETRLIIRRIKK